MFETLKTHFVVPKLIFYSTIVLGALTVSLAYAYIMVDPHVILQESLKISDQINAITNHGITDSGSASDTIKATVIIGGG